MILKNFKHTETKGTTALDKVFFAEVEVETGRLFWKKTSRRAIRRTFAGCWHFVDSGEFTPTFQAERLARAYTAQTGVEV